MGKAHELVSGRALNPGATLTAVTVNTGNSLAVRSFAASSAAWLEGLWAQNATAGIVRVRSPKMHDAVQGLRVRSTADRVFDLLSDYSASRLYPTDTLTLEISGGGAETDVAVLSVYYDDLDGSDAKLASWEQIRGSVANLFTAEVAVAGPTTAGDWSAGVNLNTTFDLFKADTKYAVLGYTVDVECAAVAIVGPDTGNYRTGGPGCIQVLETRDWFIRQSIVTGRPHIPVINSNNRAGTQAVVCHDTAGGTFNVNLFMAELAA